MFIAQVTNHCYCSSYELFLAFKLRVTVCYTSYGLLFKYESLVTVYITSYELLLLRKLQVTSCIRAT